MTEEKKIANEMMSDDELEQVAGGSIQEIREIKDLFNTAVKSGETFKNFYEFLENAGITGYDMSYTEDTIVVSVCTGNVWKREAKPNKYSLNGVSITHEQAVDHLKDFYGLE